MMNTRNHPEAPGGSSKSSSNIKVVVRVRPINEKEKVHIAGIIVNIIDDKILVFDPKEEETNFYFHGAKQKIRDIAKKPKKDMLFSFDRVFDSDVDNLEVFENSTKPLIDSLMDGMNCSVFAYGATGAGKTYTMLGSPDNPGITFLTMEQLFATKEQLSKERDFELGITYLEVYNEIVQDLLNPGAVLQLREDAKFGVVVAGIKFVHIKSPKDLFRLLEQGNNNRTQHPTDANAESSRSHAVFQVYLKMKFKTTGETLMAKLSMIDLAGSERGSATGYRGARFAEGANINKSLLALGNCINSLADGHKHVPYRDSKLTRLLKDSLGGNCKTVMIANVSPSFLSYEDTYNTLRYAKRAKAIKAVIKRNVVNVKFRPDEYVKMIDGLNQQVATMKAEIANLRSRKPESASTISPELRAEIELLYDNLKKVAEKKHTMEISQQIVQLRKVLKEDVNARLSNLYFDQHEKADRHKKLDDAIYRCHKQRETYETEIKIIEKNFNKLQKQSKDMATKHPEAVPLLKEKELELQKVLDQFKLQLLEKENSSYKNEFAIQVELIEKLSIFSRTTYTQLKGMKYAPESLTEKYKALLGMYNSRKDLKWEDEAVASTSSPRGAQVTEPSTPSNEENENFDAGVATSSPIRNVTITIPNETPISKSANVTRTITFKSPKLLSQRSQRGYQQSPLKRVGTAKLKENHPNRVNRTSSLKYSQGKKGIALPSASVRDKSKSPRPPFHRF